MQFDPVYARLMVRLIDYDTEYELKEWDMAITGDQTAITNIRTR